MKNYVTKKDERELGKLWKGIEENLISMSKKNKPLHKLRFDVIIENLNMFIQNSYWRRKYKNAPSYICKLYIAVQYCRSYDTFSNDKENRILQNECMASEWCIEQNLNIEDYEYMRENVAGMIQAKIMYSNIIEHLKSLKEGEKFTITLNCKEIYNPNFNEKCNRK